MKKTFLTSACVAALFAAMPALAAGSGNNKSDVKQQGDTEVAQVTQSGGNDDSTVLQGYDVAGNIVSSSSNNNATVNMTGT